MAYTYSFFDGQTAGAEELNRWVSLFVSGGVADCFENGVPYSLTKLNDMVKNNCSEGVVPQNNRSLQVSVVGNNVVIEPGIAFFADGSVIEITEKETLSFAKGTECFVYLVSNSEENKAYPAVAKTLPQGNVVPLAKISAESTLEDLRRYAKGRVPSFYASDAGLSGIGTFVIDKPGDYILTRGPHTYTGLALIGRTNWTGAPEQVNTLSYFMANLETREVEGVALRLKALNEQSGFSFQDVSWSKSNNGMVVLSDQNLLNRKMRLEGEIVQEQDALLLRVRYTGTASTEDFLKSKSCVPLQCQIILG